MAQPYRCDRHDQDHLADVVITTLGDGTVMALCNEAFGELCLAVVQAGAGLADDAGQAAADTGQDDQATTEAEVEQTDAEAEARLAKLGKPAAPDPGTAQVVKRGTSRTRRAHEARQRAKRDKVDTGARDELNGRHGPSTAATEDAGDGPEA